MDFKKSHLLCLWIIVFSQRAADAQSVDSSMIPDIVFFPYPVSLVSCQFAGESPAGYNCSFVCTASLVDAYLVEVGSACASQPTQLGSFSLPSSAVGSFEFSSSGAEADSALRFMLNGGNVIYVCNGSLSAIGQLNPSSSYSVASRSANCTLCSAKASIGEILTVGQTGGVTLYTGFSSLSYGGGPSANGRASGSLVNFISFDRDNFQGRACTIEACNNFNTARSPSVFQAVMNEACRQLTSTSARLTAVPFSQQQFLGKPQCADPVTGASLQSGCTQDPFLTFTGSNANQQMTFVQSGTVAVCTCGLLDTTLKCLSPYYWVFASLLTVSGPLGNQTWSIPTGTVFGLSITGWGLGLKASNRDFIRIVSSSYSCSDNGNNPGSVTSLRTGCPNCTALTSMASNIAAFAFRSADDGALPKIIRVKMYGNHTKLTFGAKINHLIKSGDRIAVSIDNITVNGLSRADWSDIDAFRVYAFSGRSRFADQWQACPSGVTDCDDFVTGNILTLLNQNTISIPIGLDEFQSIYFSVTPQGADWELHSRLIVAPQLKALTASSNNRVCWGRLRSTTSVAYYASAGIINFYQPSFMSVSVWPTSLLVGVVQPITLSFTPDFTQNPLLIQLGANSTVVVKISLLNTNFLDWMQVSDLSVESYLDDAKSNIVSPSICGLLFTEFALNHQDGFPQPSACSYSPSYLDIAVSIREIYLHFAPSAAGWLGLRGICKFGSARSTCNYQLGFQGIFKAAFPTATSLVRVDITCPSCIDVNDPYWSLMAGTAAASFAPVIAAGASTRFGIFPPNATDFSDTASLVDLFNATSFRVFIERNGSGIAQASVLRLSFQPALQFNFSAPCSCSDAMSCVVESRNTFRIAFLPSTISTFTVNVSSLSPPGGFSPNRVVAQLFSEIANSSVYDFSPSFTLAFSANDFNSTARLVTAGNTGDGLLPFVGQTGDVVQVQIRPGRTVNSFVQIELPLGFWCGENFNWIPFTAANICRITLPAGTMMNAQSWNLFNVSVFNPHRAYLRSDPLNLWTLSLGGAPPGRLSPVISTSSPFIPPGQAGATYSGNRAVLGELAFAAAQPHTLTVSSNTTVSIFFKNNLKLIKGYGILLVAPPEFSILNNSVAAIMYPETFQSTTVVSLVAGDLVWGNQSYLQNNNSMLILCGRNFASNSLISFTVSVNVALVTTDPSWFIYTLDALGNAIEGSSRAVPYNGRISSWTTYRSALGSNLSITSATGNALSANATNNFIVSCISFSANLSDVTLQVSLPEGFVILNTSNGSLVSQNVIQVAPISLVSNACYSMNFTANAPRSAPLDSVYSAFVEIFQVAGSVVPLPPIASVTFSSVYFSDQTVGASQTAIFTFTTSSELFPGDTVWIQLIGETGPNVDSSRNGSTNSPFLSFKSLGTPFNVSLLVSNTSIPGSRISVAVPVTNPNFSHPGSLFSVSTSRDSAQFIEGPSINLQLESASLVTSLSPDKRPGVPNLVAFNVSGVPAGTNIFFSIQGPPGFVFANNCTVNALAATNCTGSEITDVYTVSRVEIYANVHNSSSHVFFTLNCTNPTFPADPVLNVWIITVDGGTQLSSSLPIPSFSLSDFVQFEVRRTSNACSNGKSYPIRVLFTPRNAVPSSIVSGIRLVAPAGYVFENSNSTAELRNLNSGLALSNTVFHCSSNEATALIYGLALQADVRYAFLVYAYPPVADNRGSNPFFKLTSFYTVNALPIDESTVPDFSVLLPSISGVEIENIDKNFDSSGIVRIKVETGFAAGASLRIDAPAGFVFTDSLETTRIIFMNESVHNLSLTNPLYMSTDPILNYFSLTQYSNASVPVAAGAIIAWRVVPVMITAPIVAISGLEVSAQSMSSLRISLRPSVEANYVLINVSSPAGFSFRSAASIHPIDPLYANADTVCGVSGLKIEPNTIFNLTIDNVVLGSPGGPVFISVSTFAGSPTEQTNAREQSGNFNPFFLAGRLSVNSSSLENINSDIPSYVLFPLNPIANSASLASLTISITLAPNALSAASQRLDQPVAVRFEIRVDDSSYRFPTGASIAISPTIGQEVIPNEAATGDDSILSTTFSSLMVYWVASNSFNISVPVTPLITGSRRAWRIDMYANNTLINTNDGLSHFPSSTSSVPVNNLNQSSVCLTVADDALLAPQTTVLIQITLTASLPASTRQVSLESPSGILFDSIFCVETVSCALNSNQVNITSADQFMSALTPFSINITILTPKDPQDASFPWMTVASDVYGTQLGWGSLAGPPVLPMTNVAVIYPGMSGVSQTVLLIDFDVRRNNSISSFEIYPPSSVFLSCGSFDLLNPNIACTEGSTLIAGLTLNLTSAYLPSGHYSFPILATLPLVTPEINTFNIVARDSSGANTDGIYNYPGRTILDSQTLSVALAQVSLSSYQPGASAIATVSFYNQLDTTAVDAISVSFPTGYFQEITSTSQVLCLNRYFPRKSATSWVYSNATNSVTFLVDNTKTTLLSRVTGLPIALNLIPGPQTYVFQFPLVLPAITPPTSNFWVISFCPDRTQLSSCIMPNSSTALAQFPVQGEFLQNQ